MTEKNEARVRTRAPMVPIGAKTLLSLLMAVVMLVGLLPVTALAADTETHPEKVNFLDNGKYRLCYYTNKWDAYGSREYKKVTTSEITGSTSDEIWQDFTTKYATKGIGWIYYIQETGTLYIKGTIPSIAFQSKADAENVLKVIVDGDTTIERSIYGYVGNLGSIAPGLKNMTIDFRNGSTLTLSKNKASEKKAILDITKTDGNAVRSYGDLELTGDGTLKIAPADYSPNVMFGIRANNISVLDNVSLDIKMGSRYDLMNPVSAAAITCDGKLNIDTTGTVKIDVSEKIAPSAKDDRGYFKVFSNINNTTFNLTCAKSVTLKAREKNDTFVAYYDYVTGGENWYSTTMTALRNNGWTVTESAADATPYTVTMTPKAMPAAELTVGDNPSVKNIGSAIPSVTVNGGETVAVKASVELPTWLSEMYTAGRVKLGDSRTMNIYKGNSLSSADLVTSSDMTGYAVAVNVTALPAISFETSNFKPVAGQTYTVYACFPIVTTDGGKQLGSASVIATIKAVEKQDEVISSVTLTGDALTEGAASGPNLTSSDTSYTFTQSAWNPSGSIAAGKEYYTTLTLTAKEGYVFPTDWTQLRNSISVKLGDKTITNLGLGLANGGKMLSLTVYATADHNHIWGDWEKDEDGHYRKCSTCNTVSDKEAHNWGNWMNSDEDTEKRTCGTCGYEETRAKPERPISFLKINIIRPVDGATPAASDLTIRDAYVDQVEIVANSVGWYDESGNPVTGAFEKGKSYTIKANFTPKGERTFADTITTAGLFFTLGETKTLSADKKTVDYSCTFTAYESVTVDTALPTLVIGEAMPLPTVADGRTYTVFVMYNAGGLASLSYDSTENKWTDSSNAEVTGDGLKVKADTMYYYSCTIIEGNNEKVTANLTGTGNSTNASAAGNSVSANYTINAEDKIASVDLTVTAPEYGKAPANTATGADNAKYTVGTPTWSPAVTDNKFGADTYTVSIPVMAEPGYSFAEGCIYTVNGYSATYADGKVSYTFPALTAPHTHTYNDTWKPLDDTSHYRTCTDCGEGMEIAAHDFGDWTPDTTDATRHYKECSVCGHKVYGSHEESARITDTAAGIGTVGAWHTKCEVCGKTMNSGTIAALEKIDKAEVTVTAPVRNAAPTNAAVKDTETHYYVADTEWEPVVTDKFASGTKYTVKVTLEANDGYAFKGDGIFGIGDTTFTINGKKAKVVSGDAQQVVITYEFPATGSGSYNGGTGSGGTTTNKPVKSARTGDPGVMLYAAMGLLSLSGGAWVIGRKRKDK